MSFALATGMPYPPHFERTNRLSLAPYDLDDLLYSLPLDGSTVRTAGGYVTLKDRSPHPEHKA